MYLLWKSIFLILFAIPTIVSCIILHYYIRAYLFLGRFPRVSVDDPKNFPFADDYDFVAPFYMTCLFILLFGIAVVGLRKKIFKIEDRRKVKFLVGWNWILLVSLHTVPGINILAWYLD